MRYIIMCGGQYDAWKTPKHLVTLNGEPLVARTIRLLKECGVKDIAISTNKEGFDGFGVPVLKHENTYRLGLDQDYNDWLSAFYPITEPSCFIFGDVVFSPQAIKKIVETETADIMFFASAPPFAPEYPKTWAEPFAYKVVDIKKFFDCIEKAKQYKKEGKFYRKPVSWELWQVIKGTPLGLINYHNYTVINDYTCDIDKEEDIELFKEILGKPIRYCIHGCPEREWYINEYLLPSLLKQGIDRSDILVYIDRNKLGNLKAFMDCAKQIVKKWGTDVGVWHLQDDVIISSTFGSRTQNAGPEEIICGFTSFYDESKHKGEGVVRDGMWWSFPCIYIPNKIIKHFYEWVDIYVWRDNQYRLYVQANKYDDLIFKIFADNYYPNYKLINEVPNLVNHVDYLLGGSLVNQQRGDKRAVSVYWEESDLIKALEKELSKKV